MRVAKMGLMPLNPLGFDYFMFLNIAIDNISFYYYLFNTFNQ